MEIELRLLKAIYDTVYDVFAYRLGPDEWEEAEEHFKIRLTEEIDRIGICEPEMGPFEVINEIGKLLKKKGIEIK